MDETKLLLSKTSDLILAVKRGRPFAFSSFLNVEQQRVVFDLLRSNKVNFTSNGGYPEAERVITCVYSDCPPENCDFPFVPLFFELSDKVSISHRDVLGSLMSLGIKRELIGDIIFFDECCVFFTCNKICEYIIQNLLNIRSLSVDVSVYQGIIDYERNFEEINIISSSMRLDCLISEILSISRTRSAEYIENGLIYLNGYECIKKDKIIVEKDVLSIRKKGKFKLEEIVGKTKKDRIKLKVLKYV